MRGVVLSILIFIISISQISAFFSCSDNSPISEGSADLDIGERKNANGLVLGLARSDETPAFKRWSADLLIDAQVVNIINETPVPKNFSDGTEFAVSITKSTESEATIKIGDNNKTIEEGEFDSVGSFEVFVLSANGFYPGTASVDVMVGKGKLSLSSTSNLEEIVTHGGKKYGVELFSASDDNAVVRVFKCNNASSDLIEIADPVPETNSSNTTANNDSSQNITINETSNNSQLNLQNTTNNNSNMSGEAAEEKTNKLMTFIVLSSTALIIIITLFVLVRIIKNKE